LLPDEELEEDEELCARKTPIGISKPDISKPSATATLKRNLTTLF
jgi:hypothetical protein